MVDKNRLRAAWVALGMTQNEVAEKAGMSKATFSRRLRDGRFYTDEIERLIVVLRIADPMAVFFA